MFSNDRTELRRMFFQAWQRHRQGLPLQPLENLIAGVVAQHPEYHALLEDTADTLDRDFPAEGGQTNPFLHMAMHIALQEQLATDRPAGIRTIHAHLQRQMNDPHAVEHRMMACLEEVLWRSQHSGQPPDEAAYLNCLQRLTSSA